LSSLALLKLSSNEGTRLSHVSYYNFSGVTTIGAGRAVTPPLFDGSKLKIGNYQ